MTRPAVDEGFDTENRVEDSAAAIQTSGKPTPEQEDTGRGLPEPPQSLPGKVAVVLLTTALVLGGLYLLWQARQIVGWCVGGCVLAAALEPAVKRLEKHHVKRSTAILLVYGMLVLGGLAIVAVILPPLVEQIRGLTSGLDLAIRPGQEDRFLTYLAGRLGLTSYLPKLSEWLQSLSGQLIEIAGGLLSYTAGALSSVSALVSMLFIAFYLLLDGQRMLNPLLQFVPQAQRPCLQRLLGKSADAISNYITGNVTISVICGVAVFIVLVILRMPFPGARALLVAILDLIPQVGATLAGVLLVLAGLFVSPFNSLVILVYFLIYQQVENYLLTPLVYGRRVQLHPLTIFLAVVLGGVWLGVAGALLAIPAAQILRSVVDEWLDSPAAPRTVVSQTEDQTVQNSPIRDLPA